MAMLRKFLSNGMSLEENSDGIPVKEIEYEYYGRIVDLDQLARAASKEHHEQWEIKIPKTERNAGEGRSRVRMTVDSNGAIEYVETMKSILKKDDARIEVSSPVTEGRFAQYRILSDGGMIKDRYCFPVGDIIFEVDMFLKEDYTYYEWCKIDIEVKSKDVSIPELPINVLNLITAQKDNRSPEEEKIISDLYENSFITKNKYL